MPERRPLVPLLRELDAELSSQPMGRAADRRIMRAIAAKGAPKGFRARWVPAMAFVGGAALVLGVVGLQIRAPAPGSDTVALAHGETAAPSMGAFVVKGESCRARGGGGETALDGDCRLVAEHMVAQTWERATVAVDDGVLDVRAGRVVVDVEPVRDHSKPVRVEVSHGTIEVVGTRFEIEQNPRGGHVDLFEGEIRFRAADGRKVTIAPGQRHAWGDEAERVARVDAPDPEPEIEILDEEPRQVVRRRADDRPTFGDATELIERVDSLRSAGRYRQAVRVLRRAMDAEGNRGWDPRTAQVLSYELGELLSRHLGDAAQACRHFERHLARYPGGRYDSAVRAAKLRLDCGSR